MRISDWSSGVCSSYLVDVAFSRMTLCVSPPHRFQTPFMAFGEGLAGVRLVLQMSIDRVAPVIRRSDCDDRPVQLANAGHDRRDAEDRAISKSGCNLDFTDLDQVRPHVGPLNDQIMM